MDGIDELSAASSWLGAMNGFAVGQWVGRSSRRLHRAAATPGGPRSNTEEEPVMLGERRTVVPHESEAVLLRGGGGLQNFPKFARELSATTTPPRISF
jgi:hypothetical protein